MITVDILDDFNPRLRNVDQGVQIWDIVRKKWILLTPEEHVRQALVHYFIFRLKYPLGLIAVEKQLQYGTLKKRYDIVIYDVHLNPFLLVECKAPDIPISETVLHQALQYHAVVPCKYIALSNGIQHYCAKVERSNQLLWVTNYPEYHIH